MEHASELAHEAFRCCLAPVCMTLSLKSPRLYINLRGQADRYLFQLLQL